MRLLGAAEVFELLPLAKAIPLMREAFVTISEQSASIAHRQALPLPSGTGLLMGAAQADIGLAAKLVEIVPGNRDRGLPGSIGLVVLLDDATGQPLALIDGTSLTSLRTAALNGCAIDLLAPPAARIAVLVGCGTQAYAQALAMDTARNLDEIRVLGRDPERARAFVTSLAGHVNAALRVAGDAPRALDGADIVVAATNSLEPVVPGALIPDGCHVSGIGSFRPDMREFDEALLCRATVFVESRETARVEAGELIAAAEAGLCPIDRWREIGEVLTGRCAGRGGRDEIIFFKSVGHSVFDLFAARALYDAAERQGAGTVWTA